MSKWVICSGENQARLIADYLQKSGTQCSVKYESDAFRLRSLLKKSPLSVGVIVGEGTAGPDAVNVAAALAADASALEVVLVLKDASGSLRSRARRAGIARVLTFDELACAPAAGPRHPIKVPSIDTNPPSAPAGGSLQTNSNANGDLHPNTKELPAVESITKPEAKADAKPQPMPEVQKSAGIPVITFVSGRGGVGKSTICALAGHIAASWGMHVALLDLDLAFGNLAVLSGVERASDLAGFLGDGSQSADSKRIAACAAQVSERLEVFGPCRAPEYAELVQPYAGQLIAALSQTHDLVLVDTTNNWNDAVASAAQMADRLAIVSDDRPGAIPALSRCGGLAVRLGVARTRMIRIMNGCDPRQRDEAFVSRAASGLECSRELRVMDGNIEAMELLSCGRVRELIEIENPLATSVATGLAQLLQELGSLPNNEKAHMALQNSHKAKRRVRRKKKARGSKQVSSA